MFGYFQNVVEIHTVQTVRKRVYVMLVTQRAKTRCVPPAVENVSVMTSGQVLPVKRMLTNVLTPKYVWAWSMPDVITALVDTDAIASVVI